MNRRDSLLRVVVPFSGRDDKSNKCHLHTWRICLLICSAVASSLFAAVTFSGFGDVSEVGDQSVQEAGLISTDQTDSVARSEPVMEKTQQSLTVEQEHYLGRAVASQILRNYAPPYQPKANAYLNLLGQSLAVFSDRPETFAGYRFLLLDSDEVNAFGAPGGFILVTRGMIRCCENEDELAAVLAHEICHIQNQDGLRVIQQEHMTEALTMLNSESGPQFGDVRSGSLPPEFEVLVSDIVKALTISGYSPKQEQQADADAMELLRRSGYPEMAMITLLNRMGERLNSTSGLGFARTHPPAVSRAEAARTIVEEAESSPDSTRQQRFAAAMGSVVTGG